MTAFVTLRSLLTWYPMFSQVCPPNAQVLKSHHFPQSKLAMGNPAFTLVIYCRLMTYDDLIGSWFSVFCLQKIGVLNCQFQFLERITLAANISQQVWFLGSHLLGSLGPSKARTWAISSIIWMWMGLVPWANQSLLKVRVGDDSSASSFKRDRKYRCKQWGHV